MILLAMSALLACGSRPCDTATDLCAETGAPLYDGPILADGLSAGCSDGLWRIEAATIGVPTSVDVTVRAGTIAESHALELRALQGQDYWSTWGLVLQADAMVNVSGMKTRIACDDAPAWRLDLATADAALGCWTTDVGTFVECDPL